MRQCSSVDNIKEIKKGTLDKLREKHESRRMIKTQALFHNINFVVLEKNRTGVFTVSEKYKRRASSTRMVFKYRQPMNCGLLTLNKLH